MGWWVGGWVGGVGCGGVGWRAVGVGVWGGCGGVGEGIKVTHLQDGLPDE